MRRLAAGLAGAWVVVVAAMPKVRGEAGAAARVRGRVAAPAGLGPVGVELS